ncbi:hypothetical protein YC2023_089958 [Brassica napus]
MEESSTSIIPGLTDDVAALCLSRIPRSNFRVLSQVCRRWKTFLRSEHFAAVRKLTGTMEEFMCVFMKSIRGRKVYWEVFDSSGNNLGQIPPFPGPLKRGFCVAVIGGEKILFIGGYTGMKYWDFSRIPPIASGDINEFSLSTKRNPPLASADVYEFNPATNSWRKLADMNIPRYDFSLAEVDGLLYVVQGFSNDGYCLFNTEVYNPQTNQWSLMDGPVAFPIGGFAFSFKSKLYAVGRNTKMPENSWTDEFLPTVEGGYRSGLGQWNNKVLLFSRLSVRETLINGFDKEEGFKWRDCDQIKPSGSSCFFGNGNENSDATISFQGESYVVPAWSLTILPDCKKEAYNTAKITTQTSMMVKKSNEAEDTPSTLKWSWRPKNMDNFLLKGKEESTQTQLFDQKVVTNDQSNQHVENGKFNYVFEKDVKFKSGRNVIALLSITVGLANYGAFFESKPAGITGPIFITGINGDETIVKNLSAHKWSYKTGLNGFDNQLFRTEEMSKWSVENATFKSPLGNDPVVVDLMGLGKGTAWVNGNNIGRYWPGIHFKPKWL